MADQDCVQYWHRASAGHPPRVPLSIGTLKFGCAESPARRWTRAAGARMQCARAHHPARPERALWLYRAGEKRRLLPRAAHAPGQLQLQDVQRFASLDGCKAVKVAFDRLVLQGGVGSLQASLTIDRDRASRFGFSPATALLILVAGGYEWMVIAPIGIIALPVGFRHGRRVAAGTGADAGAVHHASGLSHFGSGALWVHALARQACGSDASSNALNPGKKIRTASRRCWPAGSPHRARSGSTWAGLHQLPS